MTATVTFENDKFYVTGAISTFVYTLTGSALYTDLTTPPGYSVMGIVANFGYTAGDTALAGTENIVTDAANKAVKIYTGSVLVTSGTYTLTAVAFAKKVGGTS